LRARTSDERPVPGELGLLLTLAAVQFTHIVDFMIMMPLGPQFMRLFAIGPQPFSMLVSAYTFAAATSGFVAAFWIDRFDHKRALLALYTGSLSRRRCAVWRRATRCCWPRA
jgi:predicted MFS family arabinose efflux permease